MTFPNFIPTANPFGLATPPAWFLQALLAYDPRLVLFPSVQEPCYQMGRRASPGRGPGMARPLTRLPDTQVFHAHRVYPWKRILAATIVGMSWQRVLRDLPCYDTEKVEDPVSAPDRMEAEDEAALDKAIADGADQIAADAWGTLQLITGAQVGYGQAAKRLPKGRRHRRRVHRPLGAGAGALWVGR